MFSQCLGNMTGNLIIYMKVRVKANSIWMKFGFFSSSEHLMGLHGAKAMPF